MVRYFEFGINIHAKDFCKEVEIRIDIKISSRSAYFISITRLVWQSNRFVSVSY